MSNSSERYKLYRSSSFKISKTITKDYSTSFYAATYILPNDIRDAIHSLYGFVRIADEIVDSFHEQDQEKVLRDFERDYDEAYRLGISTNPILHSFQLTVKEYNIPDEYIRSFLTSMRSDLDKKHYETEEEISDYIYGSADVVGLMCLKIFCRGDEALFEQLKQPAMRLGSAFQKVNFLRDLQDDYELLGRLYFPGIAIESFDEKAKDSLIREIDKDFCETYEGILLLPKESRLAVYVAYRYYRQLLHIIQKTPARSLISKRVRVGDAKKMLILLTSIIKNKLNLLQPMHPKESIVLLVDADNNPIGKMEKLEAHRKGIMHRAVSVLVFDTEGRWLLHRRALDKYHAGGLWTNACCTHPFVDEEPREAARRRMFEEMGMDITNDGLRHLFDFTYRAELDNGLIEHEYDSVFVYTTTIKPVPNPEEVMDWRYIDMKALEEDLTAQPDSYTPWFRIIFEQAKQHLYKYEGVSA